MAYHTDVEYRCEACGRTALASQTQGRVTFAESGTMHKQRWRCDTCAPHFWVMLDHALEMRDGKRDWASEAIVHREASERLQSLLCAFAFEMGRDVLYDDMGAQEEMLLKVGDVDPYWLEWAEETLRPIPPDARAPYENMRDAERYLADRLIQRADLPFVSAILGAKK